MKTTISNIAIIISLMIFSSNVYAGGKKSILRVNKETAIKTMVSFEKAEAEMEIENWMTSFREFSSVKENNFDTELNFESWMLKGFSDHKVETVDQEMVFENWMMKPFSIDTNKGFIESELEFEPWMLKF